MCGEFSKRATLRNLVSMFKYQALIGAAHPLPLGESEGLNVPHYNYKFNS